MSEQRDYPPNGLSPSGGWFDDPRDREIERLREQVAGLERERDEERLSIELDQQSNEEAADCLDQIRGQLSAVERERDELRSRLASQPQWRDRPTCQGRWLTSLDVLVYIAEKDIETLPKILSTRWYGPISKAD